jgi:two-component system sensor kinase FixL
MEWHRVEARYLPLKSRASFFVSPISGRELLREIPAMSVVMPAVIVLETAIILWLLMVFARRRRILTEGSSVNPPGFADYVEDAMSGVGAMKLRSSTLHAGHHASHAKRPLMERVHAVASRRSAHRHAYESGGRTTAASDSHARAQERGSGEAYFREALALLPISIVILGERGLMLMVNPQTAKLFGYESAELIDKPIDMLVPALRFGADAPLAAGRFALPGAADKMPLHELSARHNNGTEFQVEVGLNAFHFGDESVTLAFIIDRTERYELERNRRDLAHLTRVSTVGQLASSLAHELNQPLTAILSNVQAAQRFLLADPIDLAEVREILNDVVQDDYRASEVIRRIRAVVKKGDLEVSSLDLAGIIRDVVLLVRSDAIVRGISVTLDIDDALPPVLGDKVQLQQVVLNLLLNAFDAMNSVPPVDRMVSVTLQREGSKMVCMAIKDQGHGLTADKLDKIFKPFFTSKPQGLGLGLSISRTIVDMHRGRLWAENNINRGATFFVALPVSDATGQDESR